MLIHPSRTRSCYRKSLAPGALAKGPEKADITSSFQQINAADPLALPVAQAIKGGESKAPGLSAKTKGHASIRVSLKTRQFEEPSEIQTRDIACLQHAKRQPALMGSSITLVVEHTQHTTISPSAAALVLTRNTRRLLQYPAA